MCWALTTYPEHIMVPTAHQQPWDLSTTHFQDQPAPFPSVIILNCIVLLKTPFTSVQHIRAINFMGSCGRLSPWSSPSALGVTQLSPSAAPHLFHFSLIASLLCLSAHHLHLPPLFCFCMSFSNTSTYRQPPRFFSSYSAIFLTVSSLTHSLIMLE